MTDLLTKNDIAQGKQNFNALNTYIRSNNTSMQLPNGETIKTLKGDRAELTSGLPEDSAAYHSVGKSRGDVPKLGYHGLGTTGFGGGAPIKLEDVDVPTLLELPYKGLYRLTNEEAQAEIDLPTQAGGSLLHLGYSTNTAQQIFVGYSIASPILAFQAALEVESGNPNKTGWCEVYHDKNDKPYKTTTATGANVVVTSTGELQRSTSSKFFKTDIKDINVENYRAALKAVRPISYRSTADTADNPDHSWYSFIAEELAQLDPRLVQFSEVEFYHDVDDEGNQVTLTRTPEDGKPVPSGINTNAVVALQTKIMQLMLADIEALEKEKTAMKSRMTNIEKRLSALEK